VKLSYPAVFYPWDEPGATGYTAEVPDLPGCLSEGPSLAEAILMVTEAASGWILGELEEGLPVPPPSPLGVIKPAEGEDGFVNMIALDLSEYIKKYPRKTTKKTVDVEIPAYLTDFADSRRLDYSKIILDSLNAMYFQEMRV
jgi:predicted RNase H-like HicB family nuclease